MYKRLPQATSCPKKVAPGWKPQNFPFWPHFIGCLPTYTHPLRQAASSSHVFFLSKISTLLGHISQVTQISIARIFLHSAYEVVVYLEQSEYPSIIISSVSCSTLHPTLRFPIPSHPNPFLAYAATSVSDGVFPKLLGRLINM